MAEPKRCRVCDYTPADPRQCRECGVGPLCSACVRIHAEDAHDATIHAFVQRVFSGRFTRALVPGEPLTAEVEPSDAT